MNWKDDLKEDVFDKENTYLDLVKLIKQTGWFKTDLFSIEKVTGAHNYPQVVDDLFINKLRTKSYIYVTLSIIEHKKLLKTYRYKELYNPVFCEFSPSYKDELQFTLQKLNSGRNFLQVLWKNKTKEVAFILFEDVTRGLL